MKKTKNNVPISLKEIKKIDEAFLAAAQILKDIPTRKFSIKITEVEE